MRYTNKKYKEKRIEDFKDRKRYSDSYLFSVNDGSQEYIPVHPMSNEVELLKQLGLSPSDCKSVDCYWSLGDDIVFIQIYSVELSSERRPGLYARWSVSSLPMMNVVAVVNNKSISQDLVEEIMRFTYEQLIERDLLDKEMDSQLTLICELLL
jgi:hypothetical protein